MKIGFEYEGFCKKDYVLQPELAKFRDPSRRVNATDINPFGIPEGILYVQDPNKKGFNEYDFRDGYDCLAELRLTPVDSSINVKDFVHRFYELKQFLFKDGAVDWREVAVPKHTHEYAVASLNKERTNITTQELSNLKRFTGEHISYDFKSALTLGEKVGIIPWTHEEACLNRGGGLHINISPVEPKYVGKIVKKLHDKLFPLMIDFDFKSNYRQSLIFRYRDYKGTPGFEYMSFGFPLDLLRITDVVKLFEQIFEAVNQIPEQLKQLC